MNDLDVGGFEDYVAGLDRDENPFSCNCLKVLPEDISVRGNGRSETYEEGSLICYNKIENIGKRGKGRLAALCRPGLVLKGNDLKVICGWDGVTFQASKPGFEKDS